MNKHIVWFDIETTGVNITSDKIIEIFLLKTDEKLNEIDKFHSYINPGDVQSTKEAYEKHGISNDILKNAPMFGDIANEIYDFIGDSNLGGYNILMFDIPFLIEEFFKLKIIFNYRNRLILDPFIIYRVYEPRDLTSAYKKFTGKELLNAHAAEADVRATIEIFNSQKKVYELSDDLSEIDNKINSDKNDYLDIGKRFKFVKDENNNIIDVIFTFGKYKDSSVKTIFNNDYNYLDWIINKSDFPSETKIMLLKLINKYKN